MKILELKSILEISNNKNSNYMRNQFYLSFRTHPKTNGLFQDKSDSGSIGC